MERSFYLAVTQEAVHQQLGFYARTLYCYNPTPGYFYLPDYTVFIPPWTQSMVIPLYGTEVIDIRYTAPIGYQNPPASASSGYARFTASEEAGPANPGVVIASASFGRNVPTRQITVPAGLNAFTDLFPAPAPEGFSLIPTQSFNILGVNPFYCELLYATDVGQAAPIRLFDYGNIGANFPTINPMLYGVKCKLPIPAFSILRFNTVAQSFWTLII